jgi:hypothetical protein
MKIAAVKYHTTIDRNLNKPVKPDVYTIDSKEIKPAIQKLLFEDSYNYLLIRLDKQLYICEPVSREKKLYSNRTVSYHPYENELI